jgi:hypothetical protein
MTNWTTPRSWADGDVPDETMMNTHVRDNENHLYENKPFTLIPGLAGSGDVAGTGGAGTSEEWSTTTTGLTWAPSDPTTVDSHTTIPSYLYVNNPADTTVRLGLKSWAPAGAFDARLGGVIADSSTSVAGVAGLFGLEITDADSSDRCLIEISYTYSTGAVAVLAFTYTSSSYTQRGSTVTLPVGSPVYLRITRDGSNNVSFYYSANGILWQFIATQAFTFTVANIGIHAQGNATAGFQAAADWLRTSV